MKKWAFLWTAFALAALSDAHGETANSLFVQDAWIPDGWEEPVVASGGKAGRASFKPSVAAGFKKRRGGATVGLNSVTVHRASSPRKREKFTLLLDNGKRVTASAGRTVKVSGKRFRILGRRDGGLLLEDTRTKRIMRFVRQSDDTRRTDGTDSTTGNKRKNKKKRHSTSFFSPPVGAKADATPAGRH